MAIKTHLADSDSPLKEGTKLLAKCGAIVPDAAFVYEWNDDVLNWPDFFRSVCIRCQKQCASVTLKRYIYGLRSGEESKQTKSL